MKKRQLITHYPLEDVTLLGITTVLRAYKLAWLINQTTALKLAQAEDVCLETPGQTARYIVHFLFETEHCTFRLVKNGMLSNEGATVAYLIPHLRQFDFFLTVQDFTQTFKHEEFCDALRATKQVTYVAPIAGKRWLQNQADLLRLMHCC